MTLRNWKEQWHKDGRLRLLAALLVNAGLNLVFGGGFPRRSVRNDVVL